MRSAIMVLASGLTIACGRRQPAADVTQFPPGSDTEAVVHQQGATITITKGHPIELADSGTLVRSIAPDSPLLKSLRATAPRLAQDTIFFYSAEERSDWVYAGTPLDTGFYLFFEPFYAGLQGMSRAYAQVFVVGQVLLADSITGFVLRVPGMYSSTELDLWPYNAIKQRFAEPVRLAEDYGDEGYVFDEQGWLARPDSKSRYQLIQRRWQSNADMETDSVTMRTDTLFVRAWTDTTYGPAVASHDGRLRASFDGSIWVPRVRRPSN